MSEDHGSAATRYPTKNPLFLSVKPGMTVVVTEEESWWMGDVLFMEGRSTQPKGAHPVLDHLRRYRHDPLGQCRLVTHIVPAV